VKVAICECPPEMLPASPEWTALCRTVSRESPDLLLLNEMPFGPWVSSAPAFDEDQWKATCRLHEDGIERLDQLGAAVVAGTRPRELQGRRVNEAFLWTAEGGIRGVHTKQYFPDEAGYHEVLWFEAGERHFEPAPAGALQAGFLICTELMFNEHARRYGRSGAHVILVPRAVGKASLRRWQVAARMAAIVSGAYVLSSNRGGTDSRGQVFGGAGWIVDPEGDVVTETSPATPVVFHEIDPGWATRAQREYPCYVKE
jgi:N-carbamoylputrescine amidase